MAGPTTSQATVGTNEEKETPCQRAAQGGPCSHIGQLEANWGLCSSHTRCFRSGILPAHPHFLAHTDAQSPPSSGIQPCHMARRRECRGEGMAPEDRVPRCRLQPDPSPRDPDRCQPRDRGSHPAHFWLLLPVKNKHSGHLSEPKSKPKDQGTGASSLPSRRRRSPQPAQHLLNSRTEKFLF